MGMGHVYKSKEILSDGSISYTDEENKVWSILYKRQMEQIKNRACKEFIDGLDLLNFPSDKVPQVKDVSKVLEESTGWKVEPVAAIIPAKEFFSLLANKQFPAATFIRIAQELDYIQEPDIFHELFGHCPLLTNQPYADFMYEFGKIGDAATEKQRNTLFRIFWFTIEFGLLKEGENYRAYGGGILSSPEETVYSVDSPLPLRVDFDPLDALRTPFRIDILQPQYFVIEELDELYRILDENLLMLIRKAKSFGSFEPLFDEPSVKSMFDD